MTLSWKFPALRRAGACAAFVCSIAAPAGARGQQVITLQQAIEMAQRQSPQARMALAAREVARQRDRGFNARLLPQISLNGNVPQYSRSIVGVLQPDGTQLFTPLQQTNGNLGLQLQQQVPFTGGTFAVQSLISQVQLSGSQQYKSFSSTPILFQITQPIFQPNEQRWGIREQTLSIDIAERTYLEQRENIAIATTGVFFDFYSARLTLNNAVANGAVNDTLYTLNKGRFEVGKIGENDLLQSELALLRARAAVDQAQLEFNRALAALRIAINVAPSSPLDIVVTPDVPDFAVDTVVAVQQALRNQSLTSQLEFNDVDARRRIAEARLGGGPRATVVASYGVNQTAPELAAAYRNPLESQAFAVSINSPLVLWGAHSADVQAAQADRDRITSSNTVLRAQSAQNALFAALGLGQSRRVLIISAKADTVGAKRYEVAYNRYVIGRIGFDVLYLAQQEKDAALQAYVSALRAYWQAYYSLRLLTLYDFEKGVPIR